MNAIALHHITKRFGTHLAVDDLSLEVPAGSVYGFIGPNGSGKTTTIRMILHILLPDSGRIEVFGDGRTDLARDKIGYLPEERGLYKKMKVQRLLRYYGRLKGKPLADIDKNINRWIDQMELAPLAGQARRGALEGHGAESPVHRGRGRRARPADSRRAVFRPRPGQRRGAQRRGARRPARRHHHRVQHARHGRGRADVRPHLHDLQGEEGARRDAGPDPGGLRRRHGARAGRRRRRGAAGAARSDQRQRLRTDAGGAMRRPAGAAGGAGRPRAGASTSRSPGRRCTISSSASPGPARPSWRSRRRRMRKVITIATSEFVTAVRAKGFWIGILFMPVLFGGALALQKVVDRQVDAKPRTIAVIDDTGELLPSLMASVEAWNRGERDLGPGGDAGPEVPGRSGDARHPRARGRAPGAVRPRAPGRAVCLCRAAQRPAGARHLREDPLLLVGARLRRPAQLAAPLGDEGSGEAAVRRRRRQPHRRGQPDPAAGDRGARPARPDARRLGARRADRGQDPHDRRPGRPSCSCSSSS